jgi:hypothetical protein
MGLFYLIAEKNKSMNPTESKNPINAIVVTIQKINFCLELKIAPSTSPFLMILSSFFCIICLSYSASKPPALMKFSVFGENEMDVPYLASVL